MEKIILASSSPRRKELLELIGIPFTIHPSNAEEKVEEGLAPHKVVEQLALMKAEDIAKQYNEGIIIGADTIVVLDNDILGKPQDKKDAFDTLNRLQGRSHYVYSGVAIVNASTKRSISSYQVTKVFMQRLSKEEIEAYIKTNEPMDKAGSYGIQGIGALFIEKIEGDYFNVVGLPLSLFASLLEKFGISALKNLIQPKSTV